MPTRHHRSKRIYSKQTRSKRTHLKLSSTIVKDPFNGLTFSVKTISNKWIHRVNGLWLKDSSAIYHMHHDKIIFRASEKLKHCIYIGGIKSDLRAIGISNVLIIDNNRNMRTLEKVLYILRMKNG